MRLRATILVKLLAALVLPTVALFTIFAAVAIEVSRRDLDAELGRRLEAVAAAASTQVRGKYLIDLVPEQDDEDRALLNTRRNLQSVATATGAELTVLDPTYGARGDSSGTVPLGFHDYRAELDREEIARVFARGGTASSISFVGQDGKTYKAGYAPIFYDDTDTRIVLAVRAQAPASYFARLADLRERLFLWGAGLVAVSILAAILSTLFITRNIRKLAAAAERIGGGDLREPVRVRSRDELGVLGQTMDRMREQLAERDARMQQMLAGIAHEVRNPLAGMTLFAGILHEELPDGDDRRPHVEKIQRELGYLERVVNEFLEFARRPKPHLAAVDLDELLPEVAQLASTDEITIAVTPTAGLTATADRGQLRRALLNLAKNAAQAAAGAGHRGVGSVTLSAAPRDGELALRVWNRGREISPETSGKLFEPFFTTREKGTGLGLAFVREIALDHGGRVDVESADGETTFTLTLPA